MRYLCLLLTVFASTAYASGNHCSPQEQVIFSCEIKRSSKVISVCASSKLTVSEGTVAYRYGVLGKPEFQFPPQAEGSIKRFRFAHYSRYQVDRLELSFENGNYTYAVFDYYEGEEKPSYMRGVRVLPKDGKAKEVELRCSGKVVSSLTKLEGIVHCDKENALATCN
jgi:hypothetical protein